MTTPNAVVKVGSVEVGNKKPLSIIAGPCALESRDHALEMAMALKDIARKAGVGLIYKTSFDKANRTSANSARGIGFELALPIFAEIRERIGVPVLTDVHEREQCAPVGEVVDVLQQISDDTAVLLLVVSRRCQVNSILTAIGTLHAIKESCFLVDQQQSRADEVCGLGHGGAILRLLH